MKKIIKNRSILKIISIFSVAVFVLASLPLQAQAVEIETYTVTLRAGMHGNFRLDQITGDYESAKKIEFEVNNGTDFTIQSTAAIVEIADEYEGNYFVKDIENKTFYYNEKDQEYVIEYGRLVNGVEYKVEYVDNATGVQIADPIFLWGEDGISTTNIYAINISNYALANGSPKAITPIKGATTNTLTFRYNSTLTGGTTTNTTYQTVDGGTQTINETQQNPIYQAVPGAAPAAAVAATGGGGGGGADTTAIEDEETALEAEPEPEGEAQESAEATEETGEATEEATIEEEEVPLAASQQPFNLAAVLAILLGGVALILATVWIIARRRTIDVDDVDQSDEEHKQ